MARCCIHLKLELELKLKHMYLMVPYFSTWITSTNWIWNPFKPSSDWKKCFILRSVVELSVEWFVLNSLSVGRNDSGVGIRFHKVHVFQFQFQFQFLVYATMSLYGITQNFSIKRREQNISTSKFDGNRVGGLRKPTCNKKLEFGSWNYVALYKICFLNS